MVIFHSYVSLPEGSPSWRNPLSPPTPQKPCLWIFHIHRPQKAVENLAGKSHGKSQLSSPLLGTHKISPKNTNQHKFQHLAVCQNLVPLVNIKIAGKWMFIPLKMVLIGIDPYPFINHKWRSTKSYYELLSKYHPQIDNLLLIPSQLWLMIYGWSYTTLNFDHCFLNLHHLHIKKHQHQQKFQHVSIYQP